ncbi:ABC transporter permease [Fervidibacillus halotolerans]|uniref:ABC transporter permease n=1 Tax=Fervidibacillus halotolerans TaxID=2980027 RepID=A0A9E8RZH0_9BACI|nr:ABC transporter permease [Fervidibacillus halotolerans]WAA13139.1 ABC transporter permease [Fervidibacillus halotolerans]
MIGQFIKKDLLMLIRNRNELLILLLMPLVLISILGFALGGFISGGNSTFHAKVAIVDYGNEQRDMEIFKEQLQSLPLASEAKNEIAEGLENFRPIRILIDEMFGSEELKQIIQLEQVSPEQVDRIKKEDEYSAIIEIPEKFTYHVFTSAFLGEKNEKAKLLLYKNEGRQISSQIVEEVLEQFQRQLSNVTVIGKSGIDPEAVVETVSGSIETVLKRKPINSIAYYTVGMNVFFIMFVASTISSFAYREKRLQVFNRILLTNVSRWFYFFGIVFSTIFIALLQQIILYGISTIVFQVRWENVLAFLVINMTLSFAIGGFSALLTSMNFRLDSENASNVFNSIIVTLFALLGGSFLPISSFSPMLNLIGNLTPNGAGMTALLKLLQGYEWGDIYIYVVYLLVIGFVLLAVAVMLFPKRRAEI